MVVVAAERGERDHLVITAGEMYTAAAAAAGGRNAFVRGVGYVQYRSLLFHGVTQRRIPDLDELDRGLSDLRHASLGVGGEKGSCPCVRAHAGGACVKKQHFGGVPKLLFFLYVSCAAVAVGACILWLGSVVV